MSNKVKFLLLAVCCLVLIAFGLVYYFDAEQKNEVIFFNVGQGDSALINLPGNNEILIDGGPDMSVLYKLGKYLPIYNRDIELMILTHPHADHVTGLVEVLERYDVKAVLYTGVEYESGIYSLFKKTIKQKNIKTFTLEDVQLNEDVILKVIYPWPIRQARGEIKDFKWLDDLEDVNETSIVLKLDTENKDFLFTGDISVDVEEEILKKMETLRQAQGLRANVLKVAHQGSDTSSAEEFIKAVDPDIAVISVGENDYGHPSLRVIRRLERLGISVFRTDKDGDIIIKIQE